MFAGNGVSLSICHAAAAARGYDAFFNANYKLHSTIPSPFRPPPSPFYFTTNSTEYGCTSTIHSFIARCISTVAPTNRMK